MDNSYDNSKTGANSSLRILIPLFLLAFIAFLAWYFYRGGCNKTEADKSVTDTSMVSKVSTAANTPIGKIDSLSGDFIYSQGDTVTIDLPNSAGKIIVGKYSTEYKLFSFLNDKDAVLDTVKGNWFEFTNVHFKTGTSTLTDESAQQLKDMALLFKAFPQAQFKLGGYTDSTGNADLNIALSQKRAEIVSEAIVKAGAPTASIASTKGYGKEWPIGDNTTAEGRAMNRRVAVNVKAK